MSPIRRRSPVASEGSTTSRTVTRRRGGGPLVRRVVRGALLVAAGTAALSLAGPFALRPFADVAGAAGEVTVAVVLDFGGTSATVVQGCVAVPASDSRYDALSAFVGLRGLGVPTYGPGGQLCAINGTPSSGCDQVVAGGEIYWAHYTGSSGSWRYTRSAAGGDVSPGDVEGWRFQDPGTGRSGDPAPRAAADYSALCPVAPSSPTTGPSGGGHVGRSAARTRATRPSPTTSEPTTTTTTTSTYPATVSTSSTSLPETSIPPDPEVGIATDSHRAGSGGGGGADPLFLGGILVALLVAAAWVRWRRRPRTP